MINGTPSEKATKRQKLDEEVEELKRHLQIVPNEDDDFYTEAIPLTRKVPVVGYEIIKQNNKPYYKIIRADAKVKVWKLLESCGVQIITFITTQLILLVKRKYPLTRFTLDQMLNVVQLEVEEESEVSLELSRVIKAIHGGDGKFGMKAKSSFPSIWLDIVHEVELFKDRDVASKMTHCNLGYSFRCEPRGGVEQAQFDSMLDKVEGILLADMRDRWVWSLEGSAEFFVASVRKFIDENMLPGVASKTRRIQVMPIKVNVHAWKVKLYC
nr:RNA-directed DNA polymerase, eukaryota, reverse transcriptase zinc-binding domain protein [Tanacetum cinerariifolium]GEX54367.1 RNA-directed DNA polymerase, eukaryota, reverse transcriptase zinc-binding domain protein [Tanacetum cinerariifolium]